MSTETTDNQHSENENNDDINSQSEEECETEEYDYFEPNNSDKDQILDSYDFSYQMTNFREEFNQSPVNLNFSKEKIPIPKCTTILSPTDSNKKEPQFNILSVHQRYETIEIQISDSHTDEMVHSGQIIVFDRLNQSPLSLDEKESEKRENYKVINSLKRIPKSWNSFKWDKNEEFMSNEENQKFEQMLDECDFLSSDGEIREWPLDDDSDDNSMITRRRQTINFATSLLDYSTDAFEDQTDMDFYD